MSTGLWIALVAVVVALGFGGYRALTDGTFRGTRTIADARPDTIPDPAPGPAQDPGTPTGDAWSAVVASIPGADLGATATLLQFSSAFCAPCRATRRILQDVATRTPGVLHLEVDAELHLDLVRRLGVLRTPTTLVLDAAGHEVTRAAGAPRAEQVLDALTRV